MVGELPEDTTEADAQESDSPRVTPTKRVSRRNYLKGASVVALTGLGIGSSTAVGAATGGPPNTDDWQLSFEDTFDGGSLDTSSWSTGFGWGDSTNYSPSVSNPENVGVSDGRLKLRATKGDGSPEYWNGVVNTKNKVTFGTGSYLEAKIRSIDLPGCNNAFWSKPNSEAWPPEIDFMEVPTDRIGESMHNIHYSTSGTVGDSSTHATYHNGSYNPDGEDMQDRFYVYGCEWQEDAIAHYVDGNLVGRTTDDTVTGAVAAGEPFYLMLNVLVGGWPPGTVPSDWSGYDTVMEVDWVRIWDYAPNSGGGSGDKTENSITIDGGPYDGAASYTFSVTGSISPTDTITGEDEITDGTASGAVGAGHDTYQFSGEITEFSLDGNADIYVNGNEVSVEELVADNTITIDGGKYDGTATYTVSVTGALKATDTISGEDEISDGTASGAVGGGHDTYQFSGEVEWLSLDGNADIYINGQAVNLLLVERAGTSDGTVTYLVETNGRLIEATVPEATLESDNKINGGKALGTVNQDSDGYWLIKGDVTDVSSFDGDVVTTLDGSELNVAQ